jgi:hypothetical protein
MEERGVVAILPSKKLCPQPGGIMRDRILALICGIVLTAGFFMVSAAGAAERCVLAELYTSTA